MSSSLKRVPVDRQQALAERLESSATKSWIPPLLVVGGGLVSRAKANSL